MKGLKARNLYVFIYIDALPLERINEYDSPFLATLLKKGRTYLLDNIPGYSFGIQSTMFSGKLPQETKHWMPYMRIIQENRKGRDERITTYLHIQKSSILRHLYQYGMCTLLFKTTKRRSAKLCGMPLEYLKLFAIYPYYHLHENPFFIEIKKMLEDKYNTNVYFFGYTQQDVLEGIMQFKNNLRDNNDSISLIIYIDSLDGVGHAYGPDSDQWHAMLRSVDRTLFLLYNLSVRISEGGQLYYAIFSDHGMCTADEYIDIIDLLQKYDLIKKDSISFFIDATLTFIWSDDFKVRETVENILNTKLKNKVIVLDVDSNKDLLKHYGIFFKKREYGDIIVQTKPCKGFFPNFYSIIKPLKGLHGFWPTEPLQQAFITIHTRGWNDDHLFDRTRVTHIKDFRLHFIRVVSQGS